MREVRREFTDSIAVPSECPLLIGLVGASGSGKTFSALRLATGMQRVYGGDIYFIDSEARRALHYAKHFKFRHVPFSAPFGPLDYWAAIEYCLSKKCGPIVIDSMTHEHNGPGGVMDQVDQFLDRVAGSDDSKRKKNFMRAMVEPKRQRRILTENIIQAGSQCPFIFCYRAKESFDFKEKNQYGEPRARGYQPETTSPLQYEMGAQFLLMPRCDGVPTLESDRWEESQMIKFPEQFRDWFPKAQQLDEAIGERFARWAKGEAGEPAQRQQSQQANEPTREQVAAIWKALTAKHSGLTDKDLDHAVSRHGHEKAKGAPLKVVLQAIEDLRQVYEGDMFPGETSTRHAED